MKFTDFFKKIAAKYKVRESKRESEKITFNELENWVDNKRKGIENREKEIFVLIENKISAVVKELDEKVIVLENIDIEERKVEDKIKSIVRENLKNYINYVKNFKENLTNLNEKRLENFIAEINKIFLNFDKKSYKKLSEIHFFNWRWDG